MFSVVKDFLRLAKDFMDKGPNPNLYHKAAGTILYYIILPLILSIYT